MAIFFEILIYLMFAYILYEYRREWVFLLSLFTLGLIMELVGVNIFHAYEYHGYLIMPFGVPISIPCAWAVIIFGVNKIVSRSNVPSIFYPFVFGFYTLLLDIAMDPIMSYAGMWVWKRGTSPSLDFFSVPLYNFIGWFLAGFVVGVGYIFLSASKRPSVYSYVIWGILYPILWFPLMYLLKFVPYLVNYYILWGLMLFIGIIVRVYGFTKEVVSLDILFVRWSFYLSSLVVFIWSKLYIDKPYLIVPLVLSILIEIFGTSMYDIL